MQRGKYFRILANVYVDEKKLGQELIKVGHARSYDGGKRGSWCMKSNNQEISINA